MKRLPYSSQNGSAFFVILIGIVIFALLTYAVFRGASTSGKTLEGDQARMAAQEIIAFGDTMAKTVQILKLRGCSDTQLDFTNTGWKFVNGSPNTPVNPSAPASGCSVFSINDGKIQAVTFPVNYTTGVTPPLTSTQLGHGRILRATFPGVGENANQELALVIARLNVNVCLKINDILGITNPGGNPPSYTHTATDYTGSFAGNPALTDTSGGIITGKTSFCGMDTGVTPMYWRVLLGR